MHIAYRCQNWRTLAIFEARVVYEGREVAMVVDVAEGVRVARLERLPYLQGEGVPAAPDQADHLLQLQKKVHTKVRNHREWQL